MATSARIDELRKKFDENPRRYFAPLANEYRKAGDPEQAVFICEEYLPQQPGHMSGHIVYGQALFDLGRYDDARTVFETALSLDPENLIALRHLGDIARQAGDHHAARVWYQRVLEADPRNEEIAELMMSLLATPISTAAVDHAAPTPVSSAVVPPASDSSTSTAATPPAAQPRSFDEQMATTQEVEAPAADTAATFTPAAPPPVEPQSFVSRHAPSEDELLDLDSFDLGGVPLSALRNAKVEPSEQEESPAPGMGSELESFESLEREAQELAVGEPADDEFSEMPFGELASDSEPSADAAARPSADIEKSQEFTAEEFEQDPYAIAAKPIAEELTSPTELTSPSEPPSEPIELATDLDLGLPDDGSGISAFTPEPDSLDGLETFEAGMVTGGASGESAAENLDTESFFDTAEASGESIAEEAEATVEVHEEDVTVEVAAEAHGEDVTVEASPEIGEEHVMAEASAPPTPPPIPTPRFVEAQPASTQGDPLQTPAFGAIEPIAEAAVAPEAEDSFARDAAAPLVDTFGDASADIESAGDEMATSTADAEALATADSAEAGAHVPPADAAAGPGAFVTETMAELYLEQGHYDAALDIYRQLVDQRPDDIALRDRLHAAEERAWGHQRDLGATIFEEEPAEAGFSGELTADDVAPTPRTYGGPTIREFLAGVLFRRSATVVDESVIDEPVVDEVVATESDTAEMAAAADDVVPAADDTADLSPEPAAPSTRATPAPASDSVSGSLDVLFSGADASSAEPEPPRSGMEGRVVTPTAGTPAHRAPNELSLDHVFKSNAGRTSSDEPFSFDQFFSEDASEQEGPAAEPTNETRTDSNDDIAQFNAWLNGLKKS
jgi:tetratricopeptide (TPR) repeat protein